MGEVEVVAEAVVVVTPVEEVEMEDEVHMQVVIPTQIRLVATRGGIGPIPTSTVGHTAPANIVAQTTTILYRVIKTTQPFKTV